MREDDLVEEDPATDWGCRPFQSEESGVDSWLAGWDVHSPHLDSGGQIGEPDDGNGAVGFIHGLDLCQDRRQIWEENDSEHQENVQDRS